MRVSPGLGIPVARTPQALETPMLLDRDGMPTATLAYSLRKLREDYSGYAVRVRKGTGGSAVEVDVSFDDDLSLIHI